jgi:hypothetical protein
MENVHTDVICLICQYLVDHDDYLNFCLFSKNIYNRIKKRKDTRPLIAIYKEFFREDRYVRWKGKYTRGCFPEFSSIQTIHFNPKEIYTVVVNLTRESKVENIGCEMDILDMIHPIIDRSIEGETYIMNNVYEKTVAISNIANNSFGNSNMKDLEWRMQPSYGSLPDGTSFIVQKGEHVDKYYSLSDENLQKHITEINYYIPEKIKSLKLPPYVFQGIGNWPEDIFILFPEVHFLPYKTIFGVLVPKHLLSNVIREIESIFKLEASLYLISSKEKEMCFKYEHRYEHKNCLNTLVNNIRKYLGKFF